MQLDDRYEAYAQSIDRRISQCNHLHMRTTITISEELLKAEQRVTGKTGYSDAIVTSIGEYLALRKRLSLLEALFERKAPRSSNQIKKKRRKRAWSS